MRNMTRVAPLLCVCVLLWVCGGARATERVAQWGVQVAPGSACAGDADCALARAVCYRTTSSEVGVCACAFGSWWRAEEAACVETAAWVALNASFGVVHLDQRVRLAGRGLDTPAPALEWAETFESALRTVPPPAMPYAWRCHAASRACATRSDGVDIVTMHPDDWVLVRHRSLGTRTLAASRVAFRCTPSAATRYRRVLDNQALVSFGNAGMRALAEHCGVCDAAWCNYRGACSGDFVCACDVGWVGAQCETPTVARAAALETLAASALEVRACSSDAECGSQPAHVCAHGGAWAGRALARACVCAPGYLPDPVAGVLRCVPAAATEVVVGARVDNATVDIAFAASMPRWVWWSWSSADGVVRAQHVAYVAIGYAAAEVPRWEPVWVFRAFVCVEGSFFWDPARPSDPAAHCRGAVAVCGAGVDATRSDAATGRCECAANYVWSGGRCDACAPAWAGPACALNASSCAFESCSGRGACAGGLVATRAAQTVPRAEIYDAPGETVLPLFGVTGDAGYDADGALVVDTRNHTHTVALVYPTRDDVFYAHPDTGALEWLSYGRGGAVRVDEAKPVCRCAPGVGGERCDREVGACAREACGVAVDDEVRGQCVRTAWGTECEAQRVDGAVAWFGAFANISGAACRASRCSGHGSCLYQQQGCVCDAGFEGRACESRACGAFGRPSVANASLCECDAGVEGDACDVWVCNRDSRLDPVTGVCVCAGLWSLDPVTAMCTKHPCGWGEPRAGAPAQCACRNANATRHATAPYCRQKCAHADGFDERGACVCAPKWTGLWCDREVGPAEVPPGGEPWYPSGESLRDPSLTLGVITLAVSLVGSLFVFSYEAIASRVRLGA